ncbi:MAG: hypothetical protein ABGZ08_12040, partial [Akkermansiaceae bacterium]
QCQILSTAGRLEYTQGLALAKEIIERPHHLQDPFIPLMAWHVVETHCKDQAEAVLGVFTNPKLWASPFFLNHIAPRLMRRFAEAGTRGDFLCCARLLELAPDLAARAALMGGFEKAFEGRTIPVLPDELNSRLGRPSLSMRIRRGEVQALEEGTKLLSNSQATSADRLAVIRAFGTYQGNAEVWKKLLALAISVDAPSLNRDAIVALQNYDDKEIGETLVSFYAKSPPEFHSAILHLLSSRPVWALTLLQAVGPNDIP